MTRFPSQFKLSRRGFLTTALACFAVSSQSGCSHTPAILLSAADDVFGQHYILAMTPKGELRFKIKVPIRCHDIVVHPSEPIAVFIGRRPARQAFIVNFQTGRLVNRVMTSEDRHFYGHGCFSQQGAYFYCSENDLATLDGLLSIYRYQSESQGLIKADEIPLGEIGPHQLKLVNQANVNQANIMAIAIGGIQTHPATGRAFLNQDTMRPGLIYVDLDTHQIIERVRPVDPYLSIRHLDVHQDTVFFACQYYGPHDPMMKLVGKHRLGQNIEWLDAPSVAQLQMNQYVASIQVNAKEVIASCPKGNCLLKWDQTSGRFNSLIKAFDASGIAFIDDHWHLTTGKGKLISYERESAHQAALHPSLQFDNHMVATPLYRQPPQAKLPS